jgi:hypothetical protein
LQSNDSLKLVSGGRLNYQKADSILNLIPDRSICAEYFSTTSTNKVTDNKASFNIYPNPVGNNLTIELNHFSNSSSIKIQLFNAHGQIMVSKILDNGTYNTQLSMQHLATGIYFIQLQVDGTQFSKKVIKE